MSASPPNFDRVARLYRPMEYLSFGLLLERCRFHHLPALAACKSALVLGDGDGRFLARLLAVNPRIKAHAVDASPAMLRLLAARAAPSQSRLTTTCADARAFTPPGADYDLVVTHFFLDCLTSAELDRLIFRLQPRLAPGALWLISEFETPAGHHLRAALASALITSLYSAFHLLTGLAVRQIPPWRERLSRAGFTHRASASWLGGLLVSELWQATAPSSEVSHQRMASSCESSFMIMKIPGIDPGPMPAPDPPPVPIPEPAPGPPPEPDPMPYPGPIPAPEPVT